MRYQVAFVVFLSLALFSGERAPVQIRESDRLFLKLRELRYAGEGPVAYDSTSIRGAMYITVLYDDTATVALVDAVCYYDTYTKHLCFVYLCEHDTMRVWHSATGTVLTLGVGKDFPYFHATPQPDEESIDPPPGRMVDQEDAWLFAFAVSSRGGFCSALACS